jgi:hypothetical protein
MGEIILTCRMAIHGSALGEVTDNVLGCRDECLCWQRRNVSCLHDKVKGIVIRSDESGRMVIAKPVLQHA